jgi:hypothetical protein
LEGGTEGIKMNENNEIPILAFVDDIVLLECDKREAQHQVTMVQDYLKGLGMSISWNKSQTLQVVSKEDTWYVRDPDIIIENDRIPNIAREEAFRYLAQKSDHGKSCDVELSCRKY